jgi:hypothetical protein
LQTEGLFLPKRTQFFKFGIETPSQGKIDESKLTFGAARQSPPQIRGVAAVPDLRQKSR